MPNFVDYDDETNDVDVEYDSPNDVTFVDPYSINF